MSRNFIVRRHGVRLTKLAIAVILMTASSFAQRPSDVYENQACAMRFRVPTGWAVNSATAVHRRKNGKCFLQVQPKNLADLMKKDGDADLYTIDVTILEGDLKTAAKESSFDQQDEKWVVVGEIGPGEEAEEIKGRNWTGLAGSDSVRCYSETQGYIGMCDIRVAALSDGRKAAAFSSAPQSAEVLEEILKSFEFVE